MKGQILQRSRLLIHVLFTGYLANLFGKNVEQQDTSKTPPAKGRDSTVTVVVHSDAIINIDRCIKCLDDSIGLEYTKKIIDVDLDIIKTLTDAQVRYLHCIFFGSSVLKKKLSCYNCCCIIVVVIVLLLLLF